MVWAAKECKPPTVCQKLVQSAQSGMSGGGGGGGGAQAQTGKYKIWSQSACTKKFQQAHRKSAPQDHQKCYKDYEKTIEDLDKCCNTNPSGACCGQRNTHMNMFWQVGLSYDQTHWASCEAESKDLYAYAKDATPETIAWYQNMIRTVNAQSGSGGGGYIEKMRKGENDPENWKNCNAQDDRKNNGTADSEPTIKNLQSAKHSPTNSQFKSQQVAGSDGNVTERHPPFKTSEEPKLASQTGGEQKKPDQPIMAKLKSFFFGSTYAAKDPNREPFFNKITNKLKDFYKGDRSDAGQNADQGKFGQSSLTTVSMRGVSKTMKQHFDTFNNMRNHAARMKNDIGGEGMAANAERFSKNADVQKKTMDQLDKQVKAIAFICQNQRANKACWKTGNTPPPLPFPFGGGSGGGEENTSEATAEALNFVARYTCPLQGTPFTLKTEDAIWHSALLLSDKGVALTHFHPWNNYKFHDQGCILSIPSKIKPGTFEVYQADPRIIEVISPSFNLVYLSPVAPFEENRKVLGLPEADRNYETLIDYTTAQKNICGNFEPELGDRIKLYGYASPVVPKTYEPDRVLKSPEGIITSPSFETQKTFTMAAEDSEEGLTGGALIEQTDQCFRGLAYLKELDDQNVVRQLVPWEVLLRFIAETKKAQE